ncbi:hypothetical protein AWF03_21540 [Escherichia coli]|nr:hypothetical protein AWF03_21540 [Escherichia coli]
MTEAMKITLSTQPADARWGEKATYSINNDGITLHLNGADDLGLIQRASAGWVERVIFIASVILVILLCKRAASWQPQDFSAK